MQSYDALISSPVGKIGLIIEGASLTSLDILPDNSPTFCLPAAKAIVADFDAYFRDPRHTFQTPLCYKKGTLFQQAVWTALRGIPSGATLTYGELARQLYSAPRAIGQACRTNPLPIIIPCHRIVAASHLGGYHGAVEGSYFAIKKWLLGHEGVNTLAIPT